MDPNIQNVLLGVIANGLTALIAPLFQRDKGKATSLKPLIRQAVSETADTVDWTGPPPVEEVCLFLGSPEVEAIVRQVYATKLHDTNHRNTVKDIRSEFVALFAFHFDLKKSDVPKEVHSLFDFVVGGCDRVLAVAIDTGVLSAHEARSAFRHRQLLDEIAGIQKNLEFLSARRKRDLTAILTFEKQYRTQIVDRYGRITPPNFDSARKLAIDDIYVAPHFLRPRKPQKDDAAEHEMTERSEAVNIDSFLLSIHRVVLLGNPGGGKSTLTSKLCYDLTSRYSDRLFSGRQVTPIPVILRDYGTERKAHNYSILQFIEATANSSYQISPPEGAFEYLFLNARAFVIFDGLDELLDSNYRQKITADVESFCNLYPAVPILVTSREVGYEQAPLDPKKFETYKLAPFDEGQIQQYVTKWFRTDTDLTITQQQQKTESFLKESGIVPDLRANPLMLALMCNIYRGENYIPQNRPDLYEKCAVMLFERWDKSRGIIATVPFEAHLKPALMYLAHWIFTNSALQAGISEEKLVSKTTDYLVERLYDDRDEAERSAKDFITFCRGRAWVFTDTGSALYQFTHRTFLEYFTAFHLVRKHRTPEALANVLIPRIARNEWDIVAQLAVQLQDKHSEGAGDEFLELLLGEIGENMDPKSWNLIHFSARCLQFIVPSPKTRKNIAHSTIKRYVAVSINQDITALATFRSPLEPLGHLLNCSNENRASIFLNIENRLAAFIQKGTKAEAIAAVEVVDRLRVALHFASNPPPTEGLEQTRQLSERIFLSCASKLTQLCPRDLSACVIMFNRQEVDIEDLIKWHGINAVFSHVRRVLSFPRAPAYSLLIRRHQDWGRAQLEKLGRILLEIPPPWVDTRTNALYLWRPPLSTGRTRGFSDLKKGPPGLTFAVLVILAVGLEGSRSPKHFLERTVGLDSDFSLILSARFDGRLHEEPERAMDRCGFTPEQRQLVQNWVQGGIAFTPGEERKIARSIRVPIRRKK